ncbi:MAG: YbaK/EbsC family protein [Patescibacteria group bacterium]
MDLTQKIFELLDKNKISYEKYEHEPVFSSEDASKVRGTDISLGAKSLVFDADDKLILIVVPADKKVDSRKFTKMYNVKNLRMVDKEKLPEKVNLERGAVTPFGSLLGLPTYFDEDLKRDGNVAFNAGKTTISVVMKARDLVEIEKPIFGNFAI